ncbi:hypothetical protein CR513_24525, partial [Mucuna pruriens]
MQKERWKDTKQGLLLKDTINNMVLIMMKCLHQLLEIVYVEQPMSFAIKGQEEKVLKLKKALYGLKQAPRAWNSHIDKYFQDNGFVRCQHEYAFYVKNFDNGDILLVCLYVDDLIFTGNNPNLFEDFKKEDRTLFKSIVGSLRYLTSTRPDIMYVVDVVFRFMEAPTSTHMKATKRILCYLKSTLDFGLFYSSSNEFKLVEFCDSDFAGDVDDRKSTTGFVFFMGGCAFTWNSKKQAIVTLSTCEAEYVAATSCTCQAIWLRRLLKEFNMNQEESTKIHIDNKSAQILAKNPVFHERSKHIDTRYHFIRECIVKKEVELVHVKTQDQVADIFTKPLKFEDFRRLRARLGVQNFLITKGY